MAAPCPARRPLRRSAPSASRPPSPLSRRSAAAGATGSFSPSPASPGSRRRRGRTRPRPAARRPVEPARGWQESAGTAVTGVLVPLLTRRRASSRCWPPGCSPPSLGGDLLAPLRRRLARRGPRRSTAPAPCASAGGHRRSAAAAAVGPLFRRIRAGSPAPEARPPAKEPRDQRSAQSRSPHRRPRRRRVQPCLQLRGAAGRARPQARQGDGRAQDRVGLARLRAERVHGLPLASRTAPSSRATSARSSRSSPATCSSTPAGAATTC